MWSGINGLKNWLKEKLEGFINLLPTWVKKYLGIKSPSKVFAEISENVGTGLANGIDDSKHKVINSAKGITTALLAEEERLQGELGKLKTETKKTSGKKVSDIIGHRITITAEYDYLPADINRFNGPGGRLLFS